jgi:amino acid adenylation domain-containing protein
LETSSLAAIGYSQIQDVFPLTPMQQGILFHSLNPHNRGAYVDHLKGRIVGALDMPAFAQAWQSSISRHGALRTAFVTERMRRPYQVVLGPTPMPIECEDLRGQSEAGQHSRLAAQLQKTTEDGFDLHRPPLMKLYLGRTGDSSYAFIWSYHHLILDGWSVSILLNEIGQRYAALVEGGPLPSQAPTSLREYVEIVSSRQRTHSEQFWASYLGDIDPANCLVWGGSGSSAAHAMMECGGVLDQKTLEALRRMAASQRITLYTLLLGAWAVVLSKYAGESRIVFGSTVADRPAELSNASTVVGLFINTVPISVEVAAGAALTEWLAGLQQNQLNVRQNSYLPLADIHRASGLPLNQGLFDSLLIFDNYPSRAVIGGQVQIEDVHYINRPNHAVSIAVRAGEELEIMIVHDTAVVDAEKAGRILETFTTILSDFVHSAARKVGQISAIPVKWREAQIAAGQGPKNCRSGHQGIVQLIRKRRERAPGSVVIRDRNSTLTYGQLDDQSDACAEGLGQLGVSPEVVVAVLHPRCAELVVAVLSIWKAGGVYLPLDHRSPAPRLAGMLEMSRPHCLVVAPECEALGHELLARLPPEHRPAMVSLDDLRRRADDVYGRPRDYWPNSLAYEMFTSGTTGQPKSVMVEHQGMLNHLLLKIEDLGLSEKDIVAQTAPATFDISIWELFAPLLAGAQTLVFDEAVVRDGIELLRQVDEAEVTILELVPTYLDAVLSALELSNGEALPGRHLRCLVSAGEALNAVLARRWTRRYTPIMNVYAPTECSDSGSRFHCDGVPDSLRGLVTVGTATTNNSVYVLDDALEPVPIGASGSIYIGGVGVSRGYRATPDQTAEVFIPDPFSSLPGQRLYRTGDRGSIREDGMILWQGRRDSQVKIRGQRTDLVEIQTALLEHKEVRQCHVALIASLPGGPGAVAFLVCGGPTRPPEGELRNALRARLPPHMIPAAFVFLDELPRTKRGKLDQGALERLGRKTETAVAALHDIEDETVARIWNEILGISNIPPDADFFALGGHSLSLMLVRVRLRAAFDIELSHEELFSHSGLADLTSLIRSRRSSANAPIDRPESAMLPPLVRGNSALRPMSLLQHCLWRDWRTKRLTDLFNVPRVVRLKGPLRPDLLKKSITEVTFRHESLRFTIEARGTLANIRVWQTPVLQWREVALDHGPEATQRAQCEAAIYDETCRPMDPTRDLPIRACLVRMSAVDHVLVITIHHLACDAISFNIIAEEIGIVYGQLADGASVSLPEPAFQYGDWSEWQQGPAFAQLVDREIAFWRTKLHRPTARFGPFGRPAGAAGDQQSKRQRLTWPDDVFRALREFSARESTTSFVTLSAATMMLLHAWTGHGDVRLGTVFSGRARPECQEMVGYFANLMLLRLQAPEDYTFRNLLLMAQREILQIHQHQELPGAFVVRHESVGLTEQDIIELFPALMIYARTPDMRYRKAYLEVVPMWENERPPVEDVVGSQADLVFEFAESDQKLDCWVTYKVAHCSNELISDVLHLWTNIIQAALLEPDRLVSEIILTSARGKKRGAQ